MNKNLTQVVKSQDVIGKNILGSENEYLGKIEDIMLDRTTGRAVCVILSSGEFLGIGNKFYELPWNAINYDIIVQGFKLMNAKEIINSAPCFDHDNWSGSHFI